MDAIRQQYVDEVDGGSAEQVREALYEVMDEFSRRSKDNFRKKLAELKEQNPPDFEAQKSAMLNELNQELIKNEINKEKTRRGAKFHSWREGPPKREAEQHVQANWKDYTE